MRGSSATSTGFVVGHSHLRPTQRKRETPTLRTGRKATTMFAVPSRDCYADGQEECVWGQAREVGVGGDVLSMNADQRVAFEQLTARHDVLVVIERQRHAVGKVEQ